METLTKAMTLGLVMLSFAATVGATEAPQRDVAALEDSRDQVAWQARNAKGVSQQERRGEAERLQGLIDSLNQGGRVDPSEVDRALNRTR